MNRRELLRASFSTALASGLAGTLPAARAQGFPAKPIRYIVPVAAGGGSDLVGRTVAERWGKLLGQNIVVENIGGGGGVIACQTLMRAPADGYALIQGYVATHGTNPATRTIPYDAQRDFTPVGLIGTTPNVLVVPASVPARTLTELVMYLRRNPGKFSYGSAGQGSLTHLTMELFKQETGTFVVHVPYRGIAPAFTDLIGGQTQAMFPGLSAAMPHIRTNRVRALAVTGRTRHPLLKDVPTLEEAGIRGFDAYQWYGVMGPAGMPRDVVDRLSETLNAVLRAPDLAERLSAEALTPTPATPDEFARFVRADIERWTKLAKARGIQLDA